MNVHAKASTDFPTVRDLGGTIINLARYIEPDNKIWSAFNPSIGRHPKKGNYVVMIRSSNYAYTNRGVYQVLAGPYIKNRIFFADLDKTFSLKNLREINTSDLNIRLDRGLEDGKLFFRDDAWHFTCVMYEDDHTPLARIAVAKLDSKNTKIVSIEKSPGFDPSIREKNWMTTYKKNEYFDFVYGPNSIVKDGQLSAWMTDNLETAGLRGGSNLHDLGDGTYLAVVHRMLSRDEKVWMPERFTSVKFPQKTYIHYFARYDENGKITHLSPGFIFQHSGIEFAAGLTDRADDFLISYGFNDCSSHIAVLPIATVMKSLSPIRY